MSITLDVTVAGASSNCYADETYYDSFFESKLYFTSLWEAMSTADKKARIVESTQALDVLVTSYRGVPYTTTQRLEFPRSIASTRYPSTAVDRRVKDAAGELIVYMYFKQDSSTGSIDSREILKVAAVDGLVDVEYTKSENPTSSQKVAGGSLERARALLNPWISSGKLLRC